MWGEGGGIRGRLGLQSPVLCERALRLKQGIVEVHFDGKSIVMNDYKETLGDCLTIPRLSSRRSQKGHREEWEALHRALTRGHRAGGRSIFGTCYRRVARP